MEWLWIPAVALVSVFIVVLCWAFFKDYTCFPCRRKRPPTPPDDVEAPRSVSLDGPLPTCPQPSRYHRPHGPPPQPPLHQPPLRLLPVIPHGKLISSYNFRGIVNASDAVQIKNGIPELDLHGLKVWEARQVSKMFLQQTRPGSRVRIITGRGLHSLDGIPKIKPQIEMLLSDYTYKEVNKGGCFEVYL